MLLVPRQLARYGMTGNVPYYGGRLTPAQAHAAEHSAPPPAANADPPQRSLAERLAMLDELHAAGTLTDDEYQKLRERIAP